MNLRNYRSYFVDVIMLTLIQTINYLSEFKNLLLVHLASQFVCNDNEFCSCIYDAGVILTTIYLNTVNNRIKKPVIFCDRLKWFLWDA